MSLRRQSSLLGTTRAPAAPSSSQPSAEGPAVPSADPVARAASRTAMPASPFAAPSRPARPVVAAAMPPFGRKAWPPALGSGYDSYLMWASDGGMPDQEDTDLAIDLFCGLVTHPGTGPVATPAPGHDGHHVEDDSNVSGPRR